MLASGVLGTIVLGVMTSANAGVGPVPGTNLGSAHGLTYMVGQYDSLTTDLFISVQCPTLTDAAGGGVHVAGNPKQSRISASSNDEDFWVGEAQTLVKTEQRMKVYAICHASTDLFDEFDQIDNVPAGKTRTLEIDCLGNFHAVGGGPVVTEGNIRRSEPLDDSDANKIPDDGWVAKVRNGLGFPTSISIGVVCIQAPQSDLTYVTKRAKVKRNKAKTLRANCPGNSSVSGGGFSIARGERSFAHSLIPADSSKDGGEVPDDLYKATVVNRSAGKSKATATAVCLR
jgi:hypothetical protein